MRQISTFLAIGFGCLVSLFSPSAGAIEYPYQITLSSSRADPYRYIGRVSFVSGNYSYIGSGTALSPYGVLTAAHNLYDRRSGFSTGIVFERGRYNSYVLQRTRASSLAILSGYKAAVDYYGGSSSRGFARDLGALRFTTSPGGGGYALYSAFTGYLTTSSYLKIAMGYGAEDHSGKVPLAVDSFRACTTIRPGYFGNRAFYVESGMSGGPVFVFLSNNRLRVAAVVVSGSNYDSGLRGIDSDAEAFIQEQLP